MAIPRHAAQLLGVLIACCALPAQSETGDLPFLQPGVSCPAPMGGVYLSIPYQHFITTTSGIPPKLVPQISSNHTLAPFSPPALPIESLFPRPKAPLVPRACDHQGRCIEAYELTASITEVDLGFRDPATGRAVLSQMLTYDGTFPGPSIVVQQGVQSLVRLRNHVFCDTTTMTPANASGHFYSVVTGLTLHLHGAATLSPFDGWTGDDIQPCQWKDYVYGNAGFMEALWYHDHSLGITALSVAGGLAGTYQVRPCDLSLLPRPLRSLYPNQYLVLSDNLFIQDEGSAFMNPSLFGHLKTLRRMAFGGQTVDVEGGNGDHVLVNGRPWPMVTVQRKPYLFTFLNAAQTRVFNLVLMDPTAPNSTSPDASALAGVVWVVGSDAGLRTAAVQAPEGITLGGGERYHVVIDFSSFAPGRELILTNQNTDPPQNNAHFCYTHLVMKFVVDGTEPSAEPFDPAYTYDPRSVGGQSDVGDEESVQSACARAMSGAADVRMQTGTAVVGDEKVKVFSNVDGDSEVWKTAMMGDPKHVSSGHRSHRSRRVLASHGFRAAAATAGDSQPLIAGAEAGGRRTHAAATHTQRVVRRRALRGTSGSGSSSKVGSGGGNGGSGGGGQRGGGGVSEYLPHALPTNGWATWSFYNNVSNGGGGTHPIHLHMVKMYVCGRRNSVTGKGAHEYETHTPKDVVFLSASDEVAFITRMGPHQGSFQFHCHDLEHEDAGLMGVFNSTSPTHPLAPAQRQQQSFWAGTLAAERFEGYSDAPVSPGKFVGEDPLVFSDPDSPSIGHDLYTAGSMPPSHQRTDPHDPTRPQPITTALLQKVLQRGYYEVFYPNSRHGLSRPVPGNKYAVVCPKAKAETPWWESLREDGHGRC